jgi:hypothetical protein
VVKIPKIGTQSGRQTSSKEKWGNKKGRDPPEDKDASLFPTKRRHSVLHYVPEEGHPVLSGAKGPMGHSAELREGEKSWQLEGFRLTHVAIGSPI